MLVRRTVTFVLVAVTLSLISGCQYVGPIAIDQGRDRYNGIIQSTSKEQTLSNIIRVRNHEPTSFMDVSEVDATTTFSSNVSGGLSGIGATATHSTTAGTLAGQVGNVAGGVTYSESPLIRYTPLLGQALVAQLVTPVSADVLEDLFGSSWRICPLLDLAASYLTADISELWPVLNILCELSYLEALAVAATKSDLTKAESATKSAQVGTLEVTTKPSSGGGNNDALTIYLNPFHPRGIDQFISWRALQLWIRLLWFYSGTQPKFTPKNSFWCTDIGLSSGNQDQLRNWDLIIRNLIIRFNFNRHSMPRFDPEVLKCLPNFIELRTKPVPPAKANDLISSAPLLKTYSALGILKNATEGSSRRIEFVSPDQYRRIIGYKWNTDPDNLNWLVSYTLRPGKENPADDPSAAPVAERTKMDREITDYLETESNIFVYEPKKAKTALPMSYYIQLNRRLGALRRYILIITDDHAPGNAYVSHFDHGTWYYIDAADQVSQKNFDLISLFLTMMAIPSALPPISPTISVGGG